MAYSNTRLDWHPLSHIFLFILAACQPSLAGAQDIKQLRQAAEQGQANAQYNLGLRYAQGRGVPANDVEAVKWWRKAAEQEHAGAQHNLGVMYDQGRGVPANDVEAAKWYRAAAEQGQANAQHNLGVMYDQGRGVPANDVEAVKWYRAAAEQGQANAQYNLGVMYVEAAKWYRAAAEQGQANAQYNLGVMYDQGRGVPANDVEAVKMAYAWFTLAAAHGHDAAASVTAQIETLLTREQFFEALNLSIDLLKRIDSARSE